MTYVLKALIVAAVATTTLTTASAMDRDMSSTNMSESWDHIRYTPTQNVTLNWLQPSETQSQKISNKDFRSQK